MLKALYDEEYLREIHIKNLLRENTEEVTEAVTNELTDKHIRSVVEMLRDMDMGSEEITAKLMEMFDIDQTQAAEYVN